MRESLKKMHKLAVYAHAARSSRSAPAASTLNVCIGSLEGPHWVDQMLPLANCIEKAAISFQPSNSTSTATLTITPDPAGSTSHSMDWIRGCTTSLDVPIKSEHDKEVECHPRPLCHPMA